MAFGHSLPETRREALDAVRSDPRAVKYLSDVLRNDLTFMLEAVKVVPRRAHNLRLSKTLPSNREFMKQAASAGAARAMQFVGEELKQDRPFILEVLQRNGLSLEYLPAEKDNDESVRAAVSNNGLSLEYASARLRAEPDIIEIAVSENPQAFKYAAEALHSLASATAEAAKDEVAAAEMTGWMDPRTACRELLAGNALTRDKSLQTAPRELLEDEGTVLEAVSNNARAMWYASDELRKDKAFILKAAARNGLVYEFLDDEFKTDKQILQASLDNDAWALQYACGLEDKEEYMELLVHAVSSNPHNLVKIATLAPEIVQRADFMEKVYSRTLLKDEVVEYAYTTGRSFILVNSVAGGLATFCCNQDDSLSRVVERASGAFHKAPEGIHFLQGDRTVTERRVGELRPERNKPIELTLVYLSPEEWKRREKWKGQVMKLLEDVQVHFLQLDHYVRYRNNLDRNDNPIPVEMQARGAAVSLELAQRVQKVLVGDQPLQISKESAGPLQEAHEVDIASCPDVLGQAESRNLEESLRLDIRDLRTIKTSEQTESIAKHVLLALRVCDRLQRCAEYDVAASGGSSSSGSGSPSGSPTFTGSGSARLWLGKQ